MLLLKILFNLVFLLVKILFLVINMLGILSVLGLYMLGIVLIWFKFLFVINAFLMYLVIFLLFECKVFKLLKFLLLEIK